MAQHGLQAGPRQRDLALRSAAQLSFTEISHGTIQPTVGFLSVGILSKEVGGTRWTSTAQALRKDIVGAFIKKALNMLCLWELGEIDAGLAGKLETSVAHGMQDLLSDTIVSQVAVDAHAHYTTVIKK